MPKHNPARIEERAFDALGHEVPTLEGDIYGPTLAMAVDVDEAWTVPPGTQTFTIERSLPTQIERLTIVGAEGGWELVDLIVGQRRLLPEGPILVRGAGGQVKLQPHFGIDKSNPLEMVVRNPGSEDMHLVVSTRSRALTS